MEKKPLCCGAARRKITPPEKWLPDLRGLQNAVFSEVHDDLYLRVLAFSAGSEQMLLISFDLDKVPCPGEYLKAITERTGIPEKQIFIVSIHSHAAPIGGWRPNEGPNCLEKKPQKVQEVTHRYEQFLLDQLLDAVEEALRTSCPAKIGWQNGESRIGENRLQDYRVREENDEWTTQLGIGSNPAAYVNHRLFVLKAESMDGKPIAYLINYAVHNCVMINNHCASDGKAMISSDIGGNVSRMLEEEFPGCVALWTSGAAGDVNPVMFNEMFYPDPETGAPTLYHIPEKESAPLIMLKILASRHYADVLETIRKIKCGIDSVDLSGGIAWAKSPGSDGEDYQVRVHLGHVGPLWLAGFSGELFTSLGEAVLRQLPQDSIVMNHDASLLAQSGYIYDDNALERDTKGQLPGRKGSNLLPGHIREALIGAVQDLSREIGTES